MLNTNTPVGFVAWAITIFCIGFLFGLGMHLADKVWTLF